MNYKIKGIITAIGEIKTTKLGTAVQQIHFEQEGSGRIFYPSALGTRIELLKDFLPGDCVELEFHISGAKGTYNNVIIDDIVMLHDVELGVANGKHEEHKHTADIDWSKSGQLVTLKIGGLLVILTSGEHSGGVFSGTVVNDAFIYNPYENGRHDTDWDKNKFKLYTGNPITLSNNP